MSPQHPQATISGTELRTLSSSQIDHQYEIHVALPRGYADSGKTYPTLYMPDANIFFGATTQISRLLAWTQEVPELIIIGIGFGVPWSETEPYRFRDYVPPGWYLPPEWGVDTASCKADSFMRFIREDVVPFVGSQYRVDPQDRCFWGDSLAGLLGLYALFCHTDLFTRYIIGSPSVLKADHEAFARERDYAAKHSDLPATVFMGAATLDLGSTLTNTRTLDTTLRARAYHSLRLKTHIFEGETHVSVVSYNLIQGLRTVFGSGKS